MRLSSFEAGVFVMGMGTAGAVGCDNPKDVAPEVAVIGSTVSNTASASISSAIAVVPTTKSRPQPELGLPCPEIGTVEYACKSEPSKVKISGSWRESQRNQDCFEIRKAMGTDISNVLGCLQEIKAFNQPHCTTHNPGERVTDKDIADAEKVGIGIQRAKKSLSSLVEKVEMHKKFCDANNGVRVTAKGKERWVSAFTLMPKILTTEADLGKGLELVNTDLVPDSRKPARSNLFKTP